MNKFNVVSSILCALANDTCSSFQILDYKIVSSILSDRRCRKFTTLLGAVHKGSPHKIIAKNSPLTLVRKMSALAQPPLSVRAP